MFDNILMNLTRFNHEFTKSIHCKRNMMPNIHKAHKRTTPMPIQRCVYQIEILISNIRFGTIGVAKDCGLACEFSLESPLCAKSIDKKHIDPEIYCTRPMPFLSYPLANFFLHHAMCFS